MLINPSTEVNSGSSNCCHFRIMAEAAIPQRPYTPELESRVDDDDEEDRDELGDDEKDRDTTAPSTPEPPTEVIIRKCHPMLNPLWHVLHLA